MAAGRLGEAAVADLALSDGEARQPVNVGLTEAAQLQLQRRSKIESTRGRPEVTKMRLLPAGTGYAGSISPRYSRSESFAH